jgi:hypothetical protein
MTIMQRCFLKIFSTSIFKLYSNAHKTYDEHLMGVNHKLQKEWGFLLCGIGCVWFGSKQWLISTEKPTKETTGER